MYNNLSKEVIMHTFYVNKNAQTNGDHEIHRLGCRLLPKKEDRVSIGFFDNCQEALEEALKTDPKAKSCPTCLDYFIRHIR